MPNYVKEYVDNLYPKTQVILIDEVQFFRVDIVDDILFLLEEGIDVYVAGLDMDYRGTPFLTIERLMGVADEVYKLHAVCEWCGVDAVYSAKKVSNAKRIELGNKDFYLPLCRKCYLKHHVETLKEMLNKN